LQETQEDLAEDVKSEYEGILISTYYQCSALTTQTILWTSSAEQLVRYVTQATKPELCIPSNVNVKCEGILIEHLLPTLIHGTNFLIAEDDNLMRHVALHKQPEASTPLADRRRALMEPHCGTRSPTAAADTELMELSVNERLMVQYMRETVQVEVKRLTAHLEWSEKLRYEATSEKRSLAAWNADLIAALDENNIPVPGAPGGQYPGTPSNSAYE
jgi:hypothetical protein